MERLAGPAFAIALCASQLVGQAPLELRYEPDLRIDAIEHDLSPISGIVVSPNGTIALAQPQDGVIRFFDRNGKPIGRFGRKGFGPGEFGSLTRMGLLHDTVYAFDVAARRLTLIAPNQTLVRTISTSINLSNYRTTNGNAHFPVLPLAVDSNGSFLGLMTVSEQSSTVDVPTGVKNGWHVIRMDSTGAFRNNVTWQPGLEACTARFGSPGRGGIVTIPFCPLPQIAVAPNAKMVVVASAEPGEKPLFGVVGARPNGDTLFQRTFAYTPAPIASSTRDSVVGLLTRNPNYAAALAKVRIPESYPPIAHIIVGTDDTAWIEIATSVGKRRWLVLDVAGNVLGAVYVQRNVRISAVSRNAMWAIEADEDGLEHVVRYSRR